MENTVNQILKEILLQITENPELKYLIMQLLILVDPQKKILKLFLT
jgi:hypothetical protein